MAKKNYETPIDMTPMIDCVFQLMIFFIVTFKLDDNMINPDIALAWSPHGPAIEKKDPGTVVIEVDKRGAISIGRAVMNKDQLKQIMKNAVAKYGYNIPVLIRADSKAEHFYVRKAMDGCSEAGVWRLKFAAMKKKGT